MQRINLVRFCINYFWVSLTRRLGRTALHFAAKNGRVKAVELLVQVSHARCPDRL